MPHATHAHDPTWISYIADPAWMPQIYDYRKNTIAFAFLPREIQRRVPFLDLRYIAQAPRSPPAPVNELPADRIREGARPMHFVFHTAFCCSTLLTRALDIPGVSMGLKEPAVLVDLAVSSMSNPSVLSAALGPTLDLLSRPFAPGEVQVVKPSNVVNRIAPIILDARPDVRAIALYSSLETFLAGIARRGVDGRALARSLYFQFSSVTPLRAKFSNAQLLQQTDLQIAAQVWLMQIALLNSIAQRFGPSRVRTLSNEAFLANPAETIEHTATFFDLALDAAATARIATSSVFQEHAKAPQIAFDAAAMNLQTANTNAAYATEVQFACAWTADLAAELGIPLKLGDTLLAS